MTYKILGSTSKGNAVIYDDRFMVDCGISYKQLENHIDKLELVFLTHRHNDHFNINAIARLSNRVRFVCGEWLEESLNRLNIKPIVVDLNKWYDFGNIKASAFMLYHDVENCGWRLHYNDTKVFHATDTSTLEGISAIGYDIYAIEHNYDDNVIETQIYDQLASGEFAHGIRSQKTHLSIQQAERFIKANARGKHKVIALHQSSTYGKE